VAENNHNSREQGRSKFALIAVAGGIGLATAMLSAEHSPALPTVAPLSRRGLSGIAGEARAGSPHVLLCSHRHGMS